MEIDVITNLITTLGFPIAVCLLLFWYVWQVYKKSEKREDELRAEIRENQEANRETIKVLSTYAEKLDVIQNDVEEIKKDITVTSSKAAQN